MAPARSPAPLALLALLALSLALPGPALAAEPDLAASYGSIKAQLGAGNVTEARAAYDGAFAPRMAPFSEVHQRITAAFTDAAAHRTANATAAYNLERQVVDKSLLQAAFLGTVADLQARDLPGAGAWFGVLRAKFPTANASIEAFEAMDRDPATIPTQLPVFEAAMAKVFLGKVREEVQEVLGNWAKPATAEEKAVEGIVYYASLEPYVARTLGAAHAEALERALQEMRTAVQQQDRAQADRAGDEALVLLAAYEAGGAPTGGVEATRFISALDGLVHEYDEYVRDGRVVDQAKYDAEVLGLFLPQVQQTWQPVRAAIAAKDAAAAASMDSEVAQVDAKVRGLAPNTEVAALALDLKSDVQRLLAPAPLAPEGDALAGLRATEEQVGRAVQAYGVGQRDEALRLLASAYLDIYAPRAEAAVPRDLNADIETLMNVRLRDQMQRGAPLAEVQATQQQLNAKFAAAAEAMSAPQTDAGLFVNSFVIIAREGFEAALVLAAVIGYLLRSGHKDKTRQVYLGAGLAVLASLALFVLVSTVFTLSGANRELLEGATALLAVVVLFYVSYWLIDKVEIKRWNRFIQGQVRSALTGGKTYALVTVAFLAVFREGLETVLFYQALLASATGASAGVSVLGGFLAGFAVLAVVFIAFTKYGVNIPMRPFFILTSAMLYYLAFAFMGAGVFELQEAGVVGVTAVPWLQSILDGSPALRAVAEFGGIHATVETLGAQAVLVLAAAAGVVWSFVVVPRREAAAEAEANGS